LYIKKNNKDMKTKTSLSWVILCLIIISSCGSTKHTQREVSIPDQPDKSKTQSNLTETDKYINTYKYLAIKEMQRVKIPASITLAQGILESSVGQSYIARNANNHFGIKCNSKWTGPTINYDDDTANECFRSYSNAEQSFIDHSDFLKGSTRYENLFNLDVTDYKGWATGLKAAGYATRSNYAELLIGIIERYQLYEYDRFQSAKAPSTEKSAQFVYNGIAAVMVRDGDTYDNITRDNKITMEKLVKYNDLEPNQALKPDMILYLKAKKSKGKESYHIVKDGETMYAISQDYAIKLDNLLAMNLMTPNEMPATGEIIYLKSKRSDPPALRPKDAKIEEVKPDEPQTTIFSDNQKQNIEQNNDFIMPKKDTILAVIPNQVKEPETPKPITQPTVVSTTVQPVAPATADNSLKNQDIFADKTNTQTKTTITPPVTAPVTTSENVSKPAPVVSGNDFHIVQKGETMYSISKMYGMKVADLQSLNGMTDFSISIGQKLTVNKNMSGQPTNAVQPVKTSKPLTVNSTSVTTTTAPVIVSKPVITPSVTPVVNEITPIDTSKRKDTIYHVVEQGETFYSISRDYKVKISDIIGWNHIKEYKLEAGQKLVVGAPEPKAPSFYQQTAPVNTGIVPLPKNNVADGKYHIVQPKQTLFSISKMYNITIDQLKQWNAITDNSISIGQKLRVKP
jgi:LysM repeat protein